MGFSDEWGRFAKSNPDRIIGDTAEGQRPGALPERPDHQRKRDARRKAARYLLGIDPGASTGLAVYDTEARAYEGHTLTFWSCYELVTDRFEPDETLIFVENPKEHGFMYGRHMKRLHTLFARRQWSKLKDDVTGRIIPIAFKVGSNRREAELLADRLEDEGYPVERVTPRTKKWDRQMIERVTGYTGPPNNEHVRDAIKIVELNR